MDRIVYCQSEEQLKEAEELATEWSLPIQIGDSEKTKSIEFDRSKPCVVVVPVNNGFMMHIPDEVNHAFPIVFDYLNDFETVENCKLVVTNGDKECVSSSFLRDKHSLIGSFTSEESGEFLIQILKGGNLVDSALVFIP
jgi:hypothetical protein